MDNLLDQHATGNQDLLIVSKQQINQPNYNRKLLLALMVRFALLSFAIFLFALGFMQIYAHKTKVFQFFSSLMSGSNHSIAAFVFTIVAGIIIIGIIILFFYILIETIQVSIDYTSKEVLAYQTSIEQKVFLQDADAKYRLKLQHEVDNKSEYKINEAQYHLLKKGDKVKIILSAKGKIFLSVEAD